MGAVTWCSQNITKFTFLCKNLQNWQEYATNKNITKFRQIGAIMAKLQLFLHFLTLLCGVGTLGIKKYHKIVLFFTNLGKLQHISHQNTTPLRCYTSKIFYFFSHFFVHGTRTPIFFLYFSHNGTVFTRVYDFLRKFFHFFRKMWEN